MTAQQKHRASAFNARVARKHIDWLTTLPTPPATFTAAAVPAACKTELRDVAQTAAIKVVGRETYPGHPGHRRVYRLTRTAADIIADVDDNRNPPCPCGHSGLRNHGGYYTCQFPPCDEHFSRGQIDQEALR